MEVLIRREILSVDTAVLEIITYEDFKEFIDELGIDFFNPKTPTISNEQIWDYIVDIGDFCRDVDDDINYDYEINYNNKCIFYNFKELCEKIKDGQILLEGKPFFTLEDKETLKMFDDNNKVIKYE